MSTKQYVVQAFRLEHGRLWPDQPIRVKTEEAAVDRAKQLLEKKAGVVAFSIEIDEAIGFYGEPRDIFRGGRIPNAA